MASLRHIAACNIEKKNFEVVRDFFGYQTGPPSQISLLRQMRLLQGHHVHLNLIRVGVDMFTDADEREIDSAVAFVRDTYATVDFGVGSVERRAISSDKADGFENIGSDDEAFDLTQQFAVDNAHIDIFFVRTYAGSRVGMGPFNGPLDKNIKGEMTGIVLALEESTTVTGFALAQLVCRYLGLANRDDADNLMSSPLPNGGVLTASQGEDMTHGSVVFFACDGILTIQLTGGRWRRRARSAERKSFDAAGARRSPPSLQFVDDAGQVRRAAREHARLRRAALGQERGDGRASAVIALAGSDDPRRVHDLETIARDEQSPADVRQLAAFLLGRIDTDAARTALLALLDTPQVPAGTVAQSLGRIGHREAFEALSRVASGWDGLAKKRAQFAMRLIAHRWNLDFDEPGEPEPQLVPLLADDMRDIVWRPASTLATQIALRSLAAEPFGIDLDDRGAQSIQCGATQLIFLLNRMVESPIDAHVLLHRKTIAGVVTRRSSQSGLYDVSTLVLTTPLTDRRGIGIACYMPNGTLVFAGAALSTASGLAFECRSVTRRGAYAARIAGALHANGLDVAAAQSGRLLRDVAKPERAPFKAASSHRARAEGA
jgi:hypothetical protein